MAKKIFILPQLLYGMFCGIKGSMGFANGSKIYCLRLSITFYSVAIVHLLFTLILIETLLPHIFPHGYACILP
jgi:hypothetical protein